MANPPSGTDERFDIALNYFAQQNWAEAVHFLRIFLSTNPGHVPALLKLVEAYLRQGDVDEAVANVVSLVQLGTRESKALAAQVYAAKALQAVTLNEENEALAYAEQALALNANHGAAYQVKINVWRSRGDRALQNGQLETATHAFREAGDSVRANQIEKLYRWQTEAGVESKARTAEAEERWGEAADLFEHLISIAKEDEIKNSWRAAALRCREEEELFGIFQEGVRALERHDWAHARDVFLRLISRRVDYVHQGKWATDLLAQAVKGSSAHLLPDVPLLSPTRLKISVINAFNARRLIRLGRFGQGRIGSAVYSRDGSFLAVATSTGVLFYKDGSLQNSGFVDIDDLIVCMDLAPSGHQLATGFRDGSIWIWRTVDGTLVHKLRGHTRKVTALVYSEDGAHLYSSSEDGTIRTWRPDEGKFLHLAASQLDTIRGLAVSPVGVQFAFFVQSPVIMITKQDGNSGLVKLAGHTGNVRGLSFSSDGKLLVSYADDRTIRLWNVISGECQRVIDTRSAGLVNTAVFSPDGRFLAVGTWEGPIHLVDLIEDQDDIILDQHFGGVLHLDFSPSGAELVSTGLDDVLRTWKIPDGDELQNLDVFSSPVNDMVVSTNNDFVIVGAENGMMYSWDVKKSRLLKGLSAHIGPINAVSQLHTGEIITGGDDGAIGVWKIDDPAPVRFIVDYPKPICAIDVSPDGQNLALGYRDGSLAIWDIRVWKRISFVQAHSGSINQIAYSPGGMMLASGGADGNIRVWLGSNGMLVKKLDGISENVQCLAYSSNGDLLVVGTVEGFIWQWETSVTWQLRQSFQAHHEPVVALTLAPAGDVIIAASLSGKLSIWKSESDTILATILAHSEKITRLRLSPDGSLLVSASVDGTVRLWGVVGD